MAFKGAAPTPKVPSTLSTIELNEDQDEAAAAVLPPPTGLVLAISLNNLGDN